MLWALRMGSCARLEAPGDVVGQAGYHVDNLTPTRIKAYAGAWEGRLMQAVSSPGQLSALNRM